MAFSEINKPVIVEPSKDSTLRLEQHGTGIPVAFFGKTRFTFPVEFSQRQLIWNDMNFSDFVEVCRSNAFDDDCRSAVGKQSWPCRNVLCPKILQEDRITQEWYPERYHVFAAFAAMNYPSFCGGTCASQMMRMRVICNDVEHSLEIRAGATWADARRIINSFLLLPQNQPLWLRPPSHGRDGIFDPLQTMVNDIEHWTVLQLGLCVMNDLMWPGDYLKPTLDFRRVLQNLYRTTNDVKARIVKARIDKWRDSDYHLTVFVAQQLLPLPSSSPLFHHEVLDVIEDYSEFPLPDSYVCNTVSENPQAVLIDEDEEEEEEEEPPKSRKRKRRHEKEEKEEEQEKEEQEDEEEIIPVVIAPQINTIESFCEHFPYYPHDTLELTTRPLKVVRESRLFCADYWPTQAGYIWQFPESNQIFNSPLLPMEYQFVPDEFPVFVGGFQFVHISLDGYEMLDLEDDDFFSKPLILEFLTQLAVVLSTFKGTCTALPEQFIFVKYDGTPDAPINVSVKIILNNGFDFGQYRPSVTYEAFKKLFNDIVETHDGMKFEQIYHSRSDRSYALKNVFEPLITSKH